MRFALRRIRAKYRYYSLLCLHRHFIEAASWTYRL